MKQQTPSLKQAPCLRPALTIFTDAHGRVHLRAGDEQIVLLESAIPGSVLVRLLEKLDGNHSLDDLNRAMESAMSAKEIESTIDHLRAHHLLRDHCVWPEGIDAEEKDMLRYLTEFGLNPDEVWKKLRSTSIAVVGNGPLADAFVKDLSLHGIGTVIPVSPENENLAAAIPQQSLLILAEEEHSSFSANIMNPRCLESQKPWLYVSLAPGQHALIGPLFVPHQTCCFSCYEMRLLTNTESPGASESLRHHVANGGKTTAIGCFPAHRSLVVQLAILEILKYLLGHRPCCVIERTMTVDLSNLQIWDEPVWRHPLCSTCNKGKE